MSIITLAAIENRNFAVFLFIWLLLAAGILLASGALRPRALLGGPIRLGSQQSAGPLTLLLILAAGAWIGAQSFVQLRAHAAWQAAGHTGPFTLKDFSPRQVAELSLSPSLAILVIALGHRLIARADRPRLGCAPSQLVPGLGRGVLAVVAVMPLVLGVALLAEAIYDRVGFQHPLEHDLLRFMKESPSAGARFAMIVGAVLIAPLSEELLFRGLFQTLLAWAFGRAAGAHSSARRLLAGRWAAILITSLIFAGVHPLWTVPPIFVLAVALGFLYEWTGNLWIPISLHALFNSLETFQYLVLN